MDPRDPVAWQEHVAAQAARWGDGQRLEACCEWLREATHHGLGDEVAVMLADKLRAAMRPKPPSLAEEALDALEKVDEYAVTNVSQLAIHDDLVAGVGTIRAALERLQQLEQENND